MKTPEEVSALKFRGLNGKTFPIGHIAHEFRKDFEYPVTQYNTKLGYTVSVPSGKKFLLSHVAVKSFFIKIYDEVEINE